MIELLEDTDAPAAANVAHFQCFYSSSANKGHVFCFLSKTKTKCVNFCFMIMLRFMVIQSWCVNENGFGTPERSPDTSQRTWPLQFHIFIEINKNKNIPEAIRKQVG